MSAWTTPSASCDAWASAWGTEFVAALIALVRAARPGCDTVADPEAHNAASRRALEKNRFELVGVKVMKSEPTDGPMAI
jgi:RimJ/RimL family protein N-acetyltransferase